MKVEEQLSRLKRGAIEVISEEELLRKLRRGRPLRVKAGFDPTAPDLHLGHAVLLRKLKHFQEEGHQAIFVVGDFTARIGDPSGQSEARPALSDREIRVNVKTYEDQVFRILDRTKTQVVYNSAWLGKLTGAALIHLASKRTVARTLEREDFSRRYKENHPIGLHEFLYPLLQGQDSVELRADVELGGIDQKFNLLVGRDLQREEGQEPQVVMMMPLLVGTDGVRKMSKSFGNAIVITDSAREMFGKVMSVSDVLMWNYYELLSGLSIREIQELKKGVEAGKVHPRGIKERLAREVVDCFHGGREARTASEEFAKIFQKKGLPSKIEEVRMDSSGEKVLVANLLAEIGLVPSRSEGRRLISQKAVTIDDTRLTDPAGSIARKGSYVIQVGKRRFKKVTFSPVVSGN